MRHLIRWLKPRALYVLIILGLLVVQANCDLALPGYTANIVNIGLQQGGIESPAAEAIRPETMRLAQVFASPESKSTLAASYQLRTAEELDAAERDRQVRRFPALADSAVWLRQGKPSPEVEEALAMPLMIASFLLKDSPELAGIREQIEKQIAAALPGGISPSGASTSGAPSGGAPSGSAAPSSGAPANLQLTELLVQLPEAQQAQIREAFRAKIAEFPDLMIRQGAIAAVREEYAALGMDMAALQTRYILLAGLMMLGVALIGMTASVLVGLIASRTAAWLGRSLRSRMFRKVLGFSQQEFGTFSSASLITRNTNDIQHIQMMLVMMLRMVFYAPILGIGGVIRVLRTNSQMTWIIGLAVGVLLVIILILFTLTLPRFKRMQSLVDRVNLVTRELLTGLPVIRAFANQPREIERFDRANRDLTANIRFVSRVMTSMMPMIMLTMNATMMLILWIGANSIDAGSMKVGEMMAFISYAMQIIMAFLMISMVSVMLPRATVAAGRVAEVLDCEPSLRDPDEPQAQRPDRRGWIEFDQVRFRYPNAEADVLENITFTARPGEITAIIGGTGSGKTTLLQLIGRYFDVTSGSLKVGGVDVRQQRRADLRRRISYATQSAVLFSGTIGENLRYGRPDASADELAEAARIAQAEAFIEERKDGYDDVIAQGGTNVSGGQKQRLSIARAIVRNPDIYLFDDTFSALDYRTDAALRAALAPHTREATVLIVAQRVGTIMSADQIIVLDHGRIAGIGTHRDLLDSCDVYRQIALSQLSAEELSA